MFEVGKKYTATFAFGKVFECIKVGKMTALVQNVEWEQDVLVPPFEQFTKGVWKEYKEPRTIIRWINVFNYEGNLWMGATHTDKKEAVRVGRDTDNGKYVYLDTIPITYTEPS